MTLHARDTLLYTLDLRYQHKKKSMWVKSGLRGSQFAISSGNLFLGKNFTNLWQRCCSSVLDNVGRPDLGLSIVEPVSSSLRAHFLPHYRLASAPRPSGSLRSHWAIWDTQYIPHILGIKNFRIPNSAKKYLLFLTDQLNFFYEISYGFNSIIKKKVVPQQKCILVTF